MKATILLCYLKTGGGHYAPARAIEQHLRYAYPGSVEPILVDGLEGAGSIPRRILEDGYRLAQSRALWVYEALYGVTKIRPVARANSALVSRALRRSLEQTILRTVPDVIAIFHFFLISPILDVLRKHRLAVPTITIVTDPFTAHPFWFLRKDQTMVLFSNELKQTALRYGLSEEQMQVFPSVLDERVTSARSHEPACDVRRMMGFSDDDRIVLLLGGGDGMPRGLKIARTIFRRFPKTAVVLICGRNARLQKRAAEFSRRHPELRLRVLGYVDNAPDLLRIADVVITKAGASTLMEILALGKTPIVTRYIWEQEKGNVDFLLRSHRGIFEPRLRRLPGVLHKLFDGSGDFHAMTELNSRQPPEVGTGQVSEYIYNRIQGLVTNMPA